MDQFLFCLSFLYFFFFILILRFSLLTLTFFFLCLSFLLINFYFSTKYSSFRFLLFFLARIFIFFWFFLLLCLPLSVFSVSPQIDFSCYGYFLSPQYFFPPIFLSIVCSLHTYKIPSIVIDCFPSFSSFFPCSSPSTSPSLLSLPSHLYVVMLLPSPFGIVMSSIM